jgi:transcriptional antiterminator Rof (Rho-off)
LLCANCIENWIQIRENRKLLIACRRYCYRLLCLFRLNLNLKLNAWAVLEDKKHQCSFMQITRERERKYKVQS